MVPPQALANERLAAHLKEIEEWEDVLYRRQQAIDLYSDWGDAAKVSQIMKERIQRLTRKGFFDASSQLALSV